MMNSKPAGVRRFRPFLLEIEVESEQQFAGIYVGRRQSSQRPSAILMHPVVFVVPGKTSPAGHERVVAIANRVSTEVPEVGSTGSSRSRAIGLLRHTDGLVSSDKRQLRAIYVVGFEQNTVPAWRLRPGWQRCSGRIVIARDTVDQVAVTLAKPHVILAMLRYYGQIDVLAKIELPDESFAAE